MLAFANNLQEARSLVMSPKANQYALIEQPSILLKQSGSNQVYLDYSNRAYIWSKFYYSDRAVRKWNNLKSNSEWINLVKCRTLNSNRT